MAVDGWDVLIVGGGPAGLSAALILGRCCRRVLICDSGEQRNLASGAIHGLLGHEGRWPPGLLAAGQRELKTYSSVRFQSTTVTSVASVPGASFGFRCDDGTEGTAQKILLATGLADDLPDLAGIREFYGHSVHHCLYCDGFEHRGRNLAAVGKGDKVIGLALMMKQWSPSVIACTDGDLLPAEALLRLQAQHIAVFTQPIAALTGRGRHLENIEFADGSTIASEALFFVTGCQQKSDLSARLGCSRDRKGGVTIDPVT
jgi:thioredoxin reductase